MIGFSMKTTTTTLFCVAIFYLSAVLQAKVIPQMGERWLLLLQETLPLKECGYSYQEHYQPAPYFLPRGGGCGYSKPHHFKLMGQSNIHEREWDSG